MRVLFACLLLVSCGHFKPAKQSTEAPQGTPVNMPSIFDLFLAPPRPPLAKPTCPALGNCVPVYRFDEAVDDGAVDDAVKWLGLAVEAKAHAVLMVLNTGGGSVEAGYKLIKALEGLSVPSYCVVDHNALSMGFAILESCSYRHATRRSLLMAHGPKMGGGGGNEEDFRNGAERLRVLSVGMAEHCAMRMKLSAAEYLAKTTGGKDWWMTVDEAISNGALDGWVLSVEAARMKLIRDLAL